MVFFSNKMQVKKENSSRITGHIQRFDVLGHFFLGAIHPLFEVVLMLFFIKVLKTGEIEKTLLALSTRSGFLLAIPISILMYQFKWKIHHIFFFSYLFAAVGLLFFSSITSVWVALFLVILINIPYNALHSAHAQIYTHYLKKDRTRRFVLASMALLIGSVFFAELDKYFLNHARQSFDFIFATAALSLILTAFSFLQFPKLQFSFNQKVSIKALLLIVKKDYPFAKSLLAWFLLGIGNLWLISYRTNLLVENQFGFRYSEENVLFLLVVLPQIVCLVFSFPFACLFDKCNFIGVRIFVNFLLALYVLFFFLGQGWWAHFIGMFFFGMGRAGGGIAWKIWVNHVAPKEKVAGYMIIHSGLTGVRMLLAPLFGLWALIDIGPVACGIISLVFISVSTCIFFSMLSMGKTHFAH